VYIEESPGVLGKEERVGAMEKGVLGNGYPQPSTPAASAAMRGNRKRDTRPELTLRSALHRQGLRFRVQRRVAAGGVIVRPDIVFVRTKTAVFVDGCFWHCCPQHGTSPRSNRWYWVPKLERNVRRDRFVDQELQLAGWSVIRVWEHDGPSAALATVVAALGREA
jgi:DNA mismatch endonuclease, patch repair protein